jgi:hypothetical protein|nr:MAG TPA: hypothetical protein [Caudoviricetes sp.]
MKTNQHPDTVDAARQLSLLTPLVEAIRARIAEKEFAGFRRTELGMPYIEVRTEQGSRAFAYIKDGLYTLETAGDKVACDPGATREAISGAIDRIPDSARSSAAKAGKEHL